MADYLVVGTGLFGAVFARESVNKSCSFQTVFCTMQLSKRALIHKAVHLYWGKIEINCIRVFVV